MKTIAEKPLNCHPYETEITVLLENPLLEFGFLRGEYSLEMSDSYVWVETESQLKDLAEALAKEKVFAVDTEQHSFRSFLGFTALIQVSKSCLSLVLTLTLGCFDISLKLADFYTRGGLFGGHHCIT